MGFDELPQQAAWRHTGEQQGFEVVRLDVRAAGDVVASGRVSALGDGIRGVAYELEIDPRGATQRAVVSGLSVDGTTTVEIVGDGAGRWQVDGEPRADLDGCFDVDLEVSAFTNALPVRRLAIAVGDETSAPAVYVRADLTVDRLEQTYRRLGDAPPGPRFSRPESRYAYRAPAFSFAARITYDPSGLVVDYPFIGERADR